MKFFYRKDVDTLQVIETKVCFHDGTLKSEILWSSLPFPLPAPVFLLMVLVTTCQGKINTFFWLPCGENVEVILWLQTTMESDVSAGYCLGLRFLISLALILSRFRSLRFGFNGCLLLFYCLCRV